MAFIPSYWRESPQRYRYEGNRCQSGTCKCPPKTTCPGEGRTYFPPRRACSPWCQCKLEPVQLATQGKVLTYTVIHIPPTQFGDEAPYALAILEMTDGARLTAQLADIPLDKVKVGLKVKLEFRRIQKDGDAGILMYGYKAVPA